MHSIRGRFLSNTLAPFPPPAVAAEKYVCTTGVLSGSLASLPGGRRTFGAKMVTLPLFVDVASAKQESVGCIAEK